MTSHSKKSAYRMLFLIATPKLVRKAEDLLKQEKIPVQHLFHAQGTATSEVMDMLGLDGIDKRIMMSMMPKVCADDTLKKMKKKLHLGMPNTGIAFTLTLSGSSGHVVQLMEAVREETGKMTEERNEVGVKEYQYSMIMAIVNQGYSEEVMDAARPAGASGGTVFHSRRAGNEESLKFWKIHVQQEREVVLILAQKEDKLAIMQAIGQKCGMQSPAQGVVMSLPVDEIAGLE